MNAPLSRREQFRAKKAAALGRTAPAAQLPTPTTEQPAPAPTIADATTTDANTMKANDLPAAAMVVEEEPSCGNPICEDAGTCYCQAETAAKEAIERAKAVPEVAPSPSIAPRRIPRPVFRGTWAPVTLSRFSCDNPEKAESVRKRVDLDKDGNRIKLDVEGFFQGNVRRMDVTLEELIKELQGRPPHASHAFYTAGVDPAMASGATCVMGQWGTEVRNRSLERFPFPEQNALMTIDSDALETWGLETPEDVVDVLAQLGADADCGASPSASSHLRWPTGETDLRGLHTLYSIDKGAEIPRVLETLHKRSWLAGYGRIYVGSDGKLHERSIVDRALASSNQPIFEFGAVLLDKRIKQDRKVTPFRGTHRQLKAASILPLTDAEEADYVRLVAEAKAAKAGEAAQATAQWLELRTQQVPEEKRAAARAALLAQRDAKHKDLPPDFPVTLNDGSVVLVAEILANREKWNGKGIRDPLEPEYGAGKAKVLTQGQTDGRPKIISLAHGNAVVYFLDPRPGSFDAEMFDDEGGVAATRVAETVAPPRKSADEIIEELRRLPGDQVKGAWVEAALPLSPDEAHQVIEEVSRLIRIGVRPLQQALKQRKEDIDREERRQAARRRALQREPIWYQPENQTEHAREVERLIMAHYPPEKYFVFGGALAEVTLREQPYTHAFDDSEAPPPKVPSIAVLDRVALLERTEAVAMFQGADADGIPKPREVPRGVLEIVLGKRDHQAPTVNGLVTHPIVLADGQIVAADGLHEDGRLIVSGGAVSGCRAYSKAEAVAAVARLRGSFLEGFRFADSDKSRLNEAAALAMLFTGVQRRMLDIAPGFAVLATTQSSGKTTLARRLHLILTRHELPVVSLPDNKDEMEKALLAILLTSPAMICLDNILDGLTMRSPALAMLITAAVFKGRVLGGSHMAEVLTNTLLAITGNNLRFGLDELTRVMPIWLEAATARPDQRRFKHADVVRHAGAIREQVLRDVVGVVAGYLNSGEHNDTRTRFPAWDRVVRQSLMWAGVADVAGVFEQSNKESEEVSAHAELIQMLRRVYFTQPFKASTLVKAIQKNDWEGKSPFSEDERDDLHEVLRLLRVRDTGSSESVGWALHRLKNRRCLVDGLEYWLERDEDSGKRVSYRIRAETD